MQETRVRFLGQEDPLEKEVATHSSILAWDISWTEEPGGLQSTGSQEPSLATKPPPPPRIKDTHVKKVSKAILRSGSWQTLVKCVLILLAT